MRPKLTGSGIITAKQLKGAVVVASMRVTNATKCTLETV
jgi:hypothetical protein